MGGQQFGAETVLLDMRRMNRVIGFDADAGVLEVEAGIQWPELVEHLIRVQRGRSRQWGIVQKQTGADRLSIGGALAANAHGRGVSTVKLIEAWPHGEKFLAATPNLLLYVLCHADYNMSHGCDVPAFHMHGGAARRSWEGAVLNEETERCKRGENS